MLPDLWIPPVLYSYASLHPHDLDLEKGWVGHIAISGPNGIPHGMREFYLVYWWLGLWCTLRELRAWTLQFQGKILSFIGLERVFIADFLEGSRSSTWNGKEQIRCTIAERLMSRVPIGFSISNIWKSKTVILYVRYVRTIMHWKFQHTKHYVSMSLCGFVSGSWGTKLMNKYTFDLCVANLGPRFILKFHAIHEVNECD